MADSIAASICIILALGTSHVYSQEKAFVDIPNFATWETARKHCKNLGQRLCLRKELCSQTATPSLLRTTFSTVEEDTWIAVADEYNEWLYTGPQTERVCEKLTQLDGPPSWDGKNCSSPNVAEQNKKIENYCSISKGVYCCQNPEPQSLAVPQKIAVYIKSRMERDMPYYHYSLKQFQKEEDWGTDKASWRNGGRLQEDLSKITLMSGFVEKKYEDPIFFCVQSVTRSNELTTTLHKISKRWCSSPWKLNFYLYGSYSEDVDSEKYLVGMMGSGTNTHSRISLRENVDFPAKFNIYGPKEKDGLHKKEVMKTPTECKGKIIVLTQKNGVISSPNFPSRFITSPVECLWKITAPSKSIIKITFKSLMLSQETFRDYIFLQFSSFQGQRVTEYNFNKICPTESVEIDDYGTFCGTQLPPSFVTTNNEVNIKFLSKRGGLGIGFALYYEMIDPPAGFSLRKISDTELQSFTWEWGKEKCKSYGKSMCAVNDICRFSRPFYGVKEGDQWAPIGDEYNDWVQIGRGNTQTCERHNKAHGPPQWGVIPTSCQNASSSRPCPRREYLYCCDAPTATISDESSSITIQVYSTVQNGVIFSKYLREGTDKDKEDSAESRSMWSPKRKANGDLMSFKLQTKRSPGYDKVVYFCSREVVPAVAALHIAYAMFLEPCEISGWTFLYSLYAMNKRQPGTSKIFVGVYEKTPHHTRANLRKFPENFQNSRSYVLYAFVDKTSQSDEKVKLDVEPLACRKGLTVLQAPSILESPGYPTSYKNNANCKWIIRLPDKGTSKGDKLKITIEELSLEDPVDILSIHKISQTLDITKGVENPQLFTNRRDFTGKVGDVSMETPIAFLLSFKSDGSVTDKGFRIRSEVVGECGGDVMTSGSVISSPNHPKAYTGDNICSWIVRAPSDNYKIELEFGIFDLLPGAKCPDNLMVIGLDSGTRLFCGGNSPPKEVQFEDRQVNIIFNSKQRPKNGRKMGGKGFKIRIHFRKRDSTSVDNKKSPQCGIQSVPFPIEESASDKIIGGKTAEHGNFPWMVMVGRPGPTCGGTLLSSRWVLSAAHCFVEGGYDWRILEIPMIEPLENFFIYAGRYQRYIFSPGEQIFGIAELMVHPKYDRYQVGTRSDSSFPYNDIAMAKLDKEAVFSPTIRPACIPTQDTHAGDLCYVSGWGSRSPNHNFYTSAINYARIPILDTSLCDTWSQLKGSVLENALCAGFPEGGPAHAQGDSGSSLVCRGKYGNFYVNGIVSWSNKLGRGKVPGVFTKVWKFVDWIKDIMDKEDTV